MESSTDRALPASPEDLRRQRGLTIATTKAMRFRHIAGDKFLVPSQSAGNAGYLVDTAAGQCTCPDFEERGLRCKHVWAVLYYRRQVAMPDGSTVTTEVRVTYSQNWAAYNRAQVEEKERARILLRGLCDGIVSPKQERGRPRLPLGDAVYGAAMKVYSTLSGRRASTDVRECEAAGLIDKAPSYNSLFRIVENPALMPLFKRLVDESAKPLVAIERSFAVDGTGFATNTYARWFDEKYGRDKRAQRWVKAHAMVGTLTNVITSVEVTDGYANDSPMLAPVLQRTARSGFNIAEVSADKAYLSHDNLALVESVGAVPYIPFKSNSQGEGSAAWERLWHLYSLHKHEFLRHYHQRSNVESTFSAVKRKFGGSVRSKLPAAQLNEVLLKCLCYNLSVLVHSIHELGINPSFWQPAEAAP